MSENIVLWVRSKVMSRAISESSHTVPGHANQRQITSN